MSRGFSLDGGIFPLFPGCRRKCEIMDSKFETGRLIFLSSCQVQIFELPDLLAQELVEEDGQHSDSHVSEPESCSKRKPNGCVRRCCPLFGSLFHLG